MHSDVPLTSSSNDRSDNVANEIVAELSSTGSICVSSEASTHLIVDAVGHVR